MDFHNFYPIHVFKDKESTAYIPTELPCLNLENPSQLPVRKVLMMLSYKLLKFSDYSCFRGQGIHCWYFYTSTLFELPWKSRSTSGSRVPKRYWYLYLMDFHNFFTIHVFEVKEFIVDILTELRCLSDLDNPSQLPVWEVLMILSYEFLKFSHYSCFRGQGIYCWYFYRATMFG